MSRAERVVIVGASLAGSHVAQELRRRGHTGDVVVVGDEDEPPYDRPPLSKGLLRGDRELELPILALPESLDVEWRLGTAAVGLDRAARTVLLSDGDSIGYDRLVIATGRRARAWDDLAEAPLVGVHTLRSIEDARRLRAELIQLSGRVVIVGAGFIGSEVASSARAHGVPVTVIGRGRTPLDGALGERVGRIATGYYRRAGIDFRPGAAVVRIIERDGRLAGVELHDGSTLDAEVLVIAIGSTANVEWLQDAGLDVDGGVAVDGSLRALDADGSPDPRVFAAGDVTRWAHPLGDGRLLSIEHWGTAVEQARHVARTIVGDEQQEPFAELPRYWSTLFGSVVKSVGMPSLGDEVVLVQGSARDRRGVVLYGRAGRTVGAVALDAPRELVFFESLVTAGAPFPPDLAVVDRDGTASLVPAAASFPARRSARPNAGDGGVRGAVAAQPAADAGAPT